MKIKFVSVLILLLFILTACENKKKSIVLQDLEKILQIEEEWIINYETKQITVGESIKIKSSNREVVDVDGTKVIAKKAGIAIVTVYLESDPTIKAEIKIEVLPKKIEIETINQLILTVDEIKYIDVRLKNGNNEIVIMESNNKEIIDVDGTKVIAKKAGTAIVTVYLESDPTIKAEIKIEVLPKKIEIELPDTVTLEVDQELTIDLIIKYGNSNTKVTLVNSNPEIVDINQNIYLKALKVGTVIITYQIEGTDIQKEMKVNVIRKSVEFIVSKEISIYVTEEMKLNYELLNSFSTDVIIFQSKDESIVTIDEFGNMKGKKEGETTIEISVLGTEFKKEIIVRTKPLVIENIDISKEKDKIYLFDEVMFFATITPSLCSQEVIWRSSDPTIGQISKEGKLVALKAGTIIITAIPKGNSDYHASITIEILVDPIRIFETLHIENPFVQEVPTFGDFEPKITYQTVYGSVSYYFNAPLNLKKDIIPINDSIYRGTIATPNTITKAENIKLVRPGIFHEETKYIVYHDTGNNKPGANAEMHAKYLVSEANKTNRARSWHYTVDEKEVIQHIPDNEVSWQGDAYDAYAKGIGVESCVDVGSDLHTVWNRTAKLMAQIMKNNDLNISSIKQHYDFNRKNCPQTLRTANLYDYAIDMVRAEYLVLTMLSDYTISFTSMNPEYLDNRGRVIKLPETATRVGYIVDIKKSGYHESKLLYSTLPGLDGTTKVNADEESIVAATSFDEKVMNLPDKVNISSAAMIKEARATYQALTSIGKNLTVMHDALLAKEYELYKKDQVSTEVVIDQFYVSNRSNAFQHDYIQLRNCSNVMISLSGWQIEHSVDGVKKTIELPSDAKISAGGTYLIVFYDDLEFHDFSNIPLPDAFIQLDLNDELGTITLINENQNVIDVVGYQNIDQYEGKSIELIQGFAMMRILGLDTNQNHLDFIHVNPNMKNSMNQRMRSSLTTDQKIAFIMDLKLTSLNRSILLEDEYLLYQLQEQYLSLSALQQDLVTRNNLIDSKLLELEGLKNPELKIINQALLKVPNQILTNYIFPTDEGVEWSYKVGSDSSYFDLKTGTHLKTSFEPKLATLVARYGNSTKEVIVNFGILNIGESTVFSSGALVPTAGGKTSAGKATAEEQSKTSGFGGIAIVIDKKVYFIGKDAYIPLNNQKGSTLAIEQLRPYGGVKDFHNMGLVNGIAMDYKGTGALYHNTSNTELKFSLAHTYGRNDAYNYGYSKIIFNMNENGTYVVSQGFTNHTVETMVTLKPGEYLWCPHTYEANLDGGTWFMQGGMNGADGVLKAGKALEIRTFQYK